MKYLICLIAVAMAGVGLAGAFLDERVAYAQGDDNDYVDVGLTLEVRDQASALASLLELDIIVVNHGSRTAYDVEVVVNIVYPEDSSHFDRVPRVVPVGIASLDNNERTLRWSIPSLGELQREQVVAYVRKTSSSAPIFDYRNDPHEYFGRVTTSSFQSNRHKGNDTARVWSYRTASDRSHYNQAEGNYSVLVSVDEASPSPGDAVNFTITAKSEKPSGRTGLTPPPIDLKVDIELTGGLSVSGDPTYPDPFPGYTKPDSVSYSNGVFNIGTLKAGDSTQNSVTLPITVASNAVVNEQCLTAKLTGNPPPGVGPHDDDVSDNVAKVCLGEPSEEVFQDGTVAVWTLHACRSDVADNACDTAAEVDVRVLTGIDGDIHHVSPVIYVKDVPGRVFDADNGSVTDGTTVSWQTATDEDPDFTGTRSGVKVGLNRSPINDYLQNWNHYQVTYTAAGLHGDTPPGKISVRSRTTGTALWALSSANSWTFKRSTQYSLSSESTVTTVRLVEFEKLGTYLLDFTADLTHATLTNPDVFSGTGRTVFHVGPIAELGVSSGGATTDQVAFTVVGVNNRNEAAESGKIVVQLPPRATVLETVPPNTGTFNANSTPPTWSWNINALEHSARRRSKGLPEGETVTLIVSGVNAGEKATAKIVYDPYLVCIGSDASTLNHDNRTDCEAVTGASWHEGTVYDYNTANNTAKITAVKGTGIGPDIPASVTTQTGTTTTVMWEEVEYLYGVPVARYEVQWLGSDWTTLGHAEIANEYWDAAPTGRRAYRVRAVNAAGVAGPWSRSSVQVPVGSAGSPLNLRTEADGNNAIDVSWDSPEDIGGSPITGYRVEWTADPEGRWGSGANTTELTYKHRGLQTGATWHYRVAARNSGGLGLWSTPVQGKTASGTPDAPGNFRATTLSDYEIELTWNEAQGQRGTHHRLSAGTVPRRLRRQLEPAGHAGGRRHHPHRFLAGCQHPVLLPGPGGEQRGRRGVVAVRFGHDAAHAAPGAVLDQRGGRRPQRHRAHVGRAFPTRRPARHPIPGAVGQGPVLGDLARAANAVGFRAVLASYRAEAGRDLALPGARQQRRRPVERLVV